MGIYSPGNLVRLDTGEIGVVVRVNPEDPYRPKVRVVVDARGERVSKTYDIELAESRGRGENRPTVISQIDPIEFGIDPLTYL